MSDPRPVPYPADTRAKGWRFELDMERFKESDTWLKARNGQTRALLLLLWAEAWQRTPCGSLPDDDEMIATLLGMTPEEFAPLAPVLRRGWWVGEDGRLYHDVLVDRVRAMLSKRDKDAKRMAAKRSSDDIETSRINVAATSKRVECEFDTKHQAPDTSIEIQEPTALVDEAAPPPRNPCPTDRIVALYHEHLPMLSRVEVINDARRRSISARWREVVSDPDIRKAQDPREAALEFFAWFFGHVATSAFLTGKSKDWRADIDFLMAPSKFARVVEGSYHREGAKA